jgi:hypothetical protein
VDTVGITAGASAPPVLVEDLVAAIAAFGPVRIEQRAVTVETLQFAPTHRAARGAVAAPDPADPGTVRDAFAAAGPATRVGLDATPSGSTTPTG